VPRSAAAWDASRRSLSLATLEPRPPNRFAAAGTGPSSLFSPGPVPACDTHATAG
jgi:hypothetical protein